VSRASESIITDGAGDFTTLVMCAGGSVVISGGFFVTSPFATDVSMRSSAPLPVSSGEGWVVAGRITGVTGNVGFAHALCLS
jgi:hypothetical protein